MKKHLFGLALFSLIVGTTAFIYTIFSVVSVNEVSAPNYSLTAPAKSCWKMKKELSESNIGSPIIKQATFNLKTKQLRWELDTSQVNTPIELNFFIKDENGMRYVNSTLMPMIACDCSVNVTSSCEWLDNLDSYENLYVTAEPISQGAYHSKKFLHEFDARKATAVLLY